MPRYPIPPDFYNKKYNCIVYYLEDVETKRRSYSASTIDFISGDGHGKTFTESVKDLKSKIESSIDACANDSDLSCYGISRYVETRSFEDQSRLLADWDRDLEEWGTRIISKSYAQFMIFES